MENWRAAFGDMDLLIAIAGSSGYLSSLAFGVSMSQVKPSEARQSRKKLEITFQSSTRSKLDLLRPRPDH